MGRRRKRAFPHARFRTHALNLSPLKSPYLHVIARWTEPLEEENGERRHVNSHDQHKDPRRRVERLCIKDNAMKETSLHNR